MRRWLLLVLGMGLSAGSWQATAAANQVIHNPVAGDPRNEYVIEMLSLALDKSGASLQAVAYPGAPMPEGRVCNELDNGGVDVHWSMTSRELEQNYLPVRIPLYRGLLGHRIFIIRDGEQSRFAAVKSFADLKRLTAGQGTLWPDTQILRSGGLTVKTVMDYPRLFPMLEGGRFDYFPRGVHEPWNEVNYHPEFNLVVEPQLMVIYRAPMYFFVNRNNPGLARIIEKGLNAAIADGSFQQTFISNPMIQNVLNQANLQQRRVFYIDNPELSPQTPLDREELWLDISQL